jgi:exodeoxyribonuclease V alpha subunit
VARPAPTSDAPEPGAPEDPSARALRVEVTGVRWSAPDGGFAVVGALTDAGAEVTLTGALDHVHEGEELDVGGRWRRHAKHGWRFEAEHVRSLGATSDTALLSLLGSVKHVGPAGAAWLLDRHGADVIEAVDGDPRSELRRVPGIGPARIGAAVRSWERLRDRRALRLFLSEHGVPATAAARIERAHGSGSIDDLRRDPYSAADVDGVGFATADALARALGVGHDDPARLEAGIVHVLREAEGDGHCLLPRAELVATSRTLLGAPCDDALEGLLGRGALVADGDLVARPAMDRLERRLARRAHELATGPATLRLTGVERPVTGAFIPSDDQWAVVDAVLHSRLAILTGGPGTGKTATMRALVDLLRARGRSVRLCAPTGKAARRLAEATGAEATTIHRLLEYNPDGGFGRGPEDPIPGAAVLVVDEASMLDVRLADALLGAVGPATHVLLVGDVDQLAPVGPGRVLEDLIASGTVPTVALTAIFRQAARSLIVRAAHAVNAGEPPPAEAGPDDVRDFFIVEREDPADLFAQVVSLAAERLPLHYELDAGRDVLVLSPMHRGPLGVDALNTELRARLNPSGEPIPGTPLRVGDRVIQTRNDHERELMNGELGVLVAHDPGEHRVTFSGDDGRTLRMGTGELGTLRLAHAISIHKSQGSQAPAVVVPVFRGHQIMLTRNLLYTAITRAERVCVLVAQPGALPSALRHRETRRRHTRLAALLREA